ncbi:type IV toxin-antitoxin system AbiEi family antitoxin domain-containing protein [Jongsikchunia kroppenstedtii]|uniref:type IV toxin-antitoxin system AbiEi family antitoxin domain-containing protein n=1 Tax=Jongsikchunia kroppenstedtii TaxID=1121721 RepID=UPI00037AFE0F|nr:type IV toxin-antitoxin system AbiEi family antitoxin [Jongsikchunia kroppenstedtii]
MTTSDRERGARLPPELARSPLRVIRPADAVGVYAHPRQEFRRLAAAGVLHRIAPGYYVVVPQDQVGRPWIPDLESAAVGVSAAIEGVDNVVAMGVTAARLHGALPRALATAVIAVPRQHRSIALTDRTATVQFVRRDTTSLDAERIATDLGPALVTTPEQTVLDLAKRPNLGDAAVDVPQAISMLYHQSDNDRLHRLAKEHRFVRTLRRVEAELGLGR